jgi:hypothetical protein
MSSAAAMMKHTGDIRGILSDARVLALALAGLREMAAGCEDMVDALEDTARRIRDDLESLPDDMAREAEQAEKAA